MILNVLMPGRPSQSDPRGRLWGWRKDVCISSNYCVLNWCYEKLAFAVGHYLHISKSLGISTTKKCLKVEHLWKNSGAYHEIAICVSSLTLILAFVPLALI